MNKRYLPMYSDTNQTNCWLIILLFSSLLTGQARLQAQSPCLTYTAPGLYSFTVPAGGPFLLKLQARGADGGDAGGTGASVESTFSLQTGDQLTLIVGQVGQSASGYGGGGGGTAVILTRNATPTLLVAAGAGAGGNTHGDILGGGGQGLGSSSGGAGGNVGTLGGEIYPGGGGGGGLASAGSQGTNGNNTIGGGGGGQASLSALSPGGTSRYASGGYGFGGGGGTGDNINGSGGGGGGYGGGRGGDARFASSRTDPTGGYSYISATGSATAITVGLGGATQHRDGLVSIQFPTSSVSATITSQTALCANPSATITGTINATGTWTIILSDGTKATGTGSSFSIQVSPTSPTTYTLQCVFDANGVAQPANIASSPTVTVVPLPTAFAVTGGGTYCAGGSGATLGLSNSQTGVSYQLYRDGNAVANTVAGTGSGIRFESQITAGTYTVQATNTTVGSCQQTMTGSATVRFNPSPTATLVSSGSLTCSTRSVTLMAGGGTSYVFSSGATPTGPTTATVANEGPYSVTVTDANGCTATQTTTVQSNTTTPSVSLTTSGLLTCTNKTVTLTAGGADTYVFSAGATSTGPNTATLSQAGTYTVTGTSAANGCSSFTTTTVQSNTVAPQDVTLNSSGTLTCATTSVNLTAGSTTQGVSYSISGPGVTGQNGSTATANQQGLYNVKVTGTNGCTATQTTTVSSNTLAPTATLGSSGTITCTNRTVILTAGGGGTYAFSSGASQVNGANTASVTTGGLYSVTVTNTTNGCSSFTTTTVEGNTTGPNASLFNSGPIADKNPTVTLTAGGGTTYAFSQGATPSGNGTATVTTPGIYSVTATSSDNGCTGVASTTVTGAQNPATICRNGTAVIKVIASGNPVKYEWYKNTLSSPRLAEITLQQRGTATSSLTLINQQTTANFYVRVTDANGSAVVYGPFKVTVNMGCVTSLGRLAAEEVELKITLLGNPLISEQLRATVSGAAGRALNIQLLDLSGKSIRQQQWLQAESEQRVEWNLGGQASGVYLLQAVTEPDGNAPAQRHSVKVIKP